MGAGGLVRRGAGFGVWVTRVMVALYAMPDAQKGRGACFDRSSTPHVASILPNAFRIDDPISIPFTLASSRPRG